MKTSLYFDSLRPLLLMPALFALSTLGGCEPVNTDVKDPLNLSDEQRAADQQSIAQALGRCLRQRVAWVDVADDSINDVAARLHQSCLYPFMALRHAKLNYADVPELTQPPAQVLEDELAMCALIVERRRVMLSQPNRPSHPNQPGWTHPPIDNLPDFNHPPTPKPKHEQNDDATLPDRWVL